MSWPSPSTPSSGRWPPRSSSVIPSRDRGALLAAMFGASFALILLELALTRVFAVVLFASFAHLALALALLGISAGALVQAMWPELVPEERLPSRLGWLLVGLALSAILAVVAVVTLPVTVQFSEPPLTYGERSSVQGDLVHAGWFSVLLPLLTLPFAAGGWAFAAAFQRKKAEIGELYAADLLGGAAGALCFIPVLGAVSGPDAVFVVALAAGLPPLWLFGLARERAGQAVALAVVVGSMLALFLATEREVLPVRQAAGYSEENITWVRWTPLTRLALHTDRRGTYMLLDNTSASEVVLTPRRQGARAREANRSAVYRLHSPPARVAILAASAGPEVAVARLHGFQAIDAIDIAPQIGTAILQHFPAAPFNPYRAPGVRRVQLDGRAAILHAEQPYDIIQMVHANLHSSAGLLASAWSPALLETRQAFDTYFDHLAPGGTLSFARGPNTHQVARAIAASLRGRGVTDPERHLMLIRGDTSVVLARAEPFTRSDRARMERWLSTLRKQQLEDQALTPGTVLTDAHPYFDTPAYAAEALVFGLRHLGQPVGEVSSRIVLYRTLALQGLFTLAAGLLLLWLPRTRPAVGRIEGTGPVLLYVAGLGYGYLAVETVLVHELVLFVGHPTYAITVVVLALLLSSGGGSLWAQRVPAARCSTVLRGALGSVLALGALQAWFVPELLHATALGLPLPARASLAFAVLCPLGFAMGIPFPLGIRLLRDDAASLVPWAWAVNGWTSVVATLGTVLIARSLSYPAAMAVALSAYLLAFSVSGRISSAGPLADSHTRA